jgi:transcriptional repressor NrdR
VRCPYCGDDASRVVDTRVGGGGDEIRRRRECEECGRRFTTRERPELVLPRIIKRDERREDYSRAKLLRGIDRACVKRPIRTEAIERVVDRIERWLQEIGEKEVASQRLGERVMQELTNLDSLAAVRFASVFRSFQSTDDYAAFFESAGDRGKPRNDES